jgi:hypothetical protein
VRWKAADGETITLALQDAKDDPVERPLGRLAKSHIKAVPHHEAADGIVVVPEDDESEAPKEQTARARSTPRFNICWSSSARTWASTSTSSVMTRAVWNGHRLGDMPRRRERLPQQFDPVTNRTIELIDVLWLDGNAIVAAFEVESTTSICSGLLRMSDLLARQPNISVPLFLVAPEERRDQVVRQVNRPTPLVDVCRYISFEGLREALTAARDYISFLKPAWLQTISESCVLEDL